MNEVFAPRSPSNEAAQSIFSKGRKPAFGLSDRSLYGLFAGLVIVGAALYLAVTFVQTNPGYPLDDSWIHQTFARNLFRDHQWAYNRGEPAAGSTAPLWTALLALGYYLPIDTRIWTYFLGLAFLAATALAAFKLSLRLFPDERWAAVASGVFVVWDWRLLWAALSGMETILFTLLTLALLHLHLSDQPETRRWFSPLLVGATAGLLVLVRPEGMILFVLVILHELWRGFSRWRHSGSPSLVLYLTLAATGFALFFVPYLLMNYALTGQPLPTTFYAKSSGYAPSFDLAVVAQYLKDAAVVTSFGPLVFLIPGLLVAFVGLVRRRARTSAKPDSPAGSLLWLPLVWVGLLVAVYAVRLPVVYHHGRYLMPLLPVLIIYGWAGTTRILRGLGRLRLRKLAATIPVVMVLATIILWINGARLYAWDVKYINDEQVRVGLWLANNTPPGALVATHDIGAIGYFSQRKLVDTAGLITPEVIPFVRDQKRILALVQEKKVNYFAMLPDWYPRLVDSPELRLVYEVHEDYVTKAGTRNMRVYQVGGTTN